MNLATASPDSYTQTIERHRYTSAPPPQLQWFNVWSFALVSISGNAEYVQVEGLYLQLKAFSETSII